MSFVPPPSRGQAGSSIEKEIERVKEECDELKGEIRRERGGACGGKEGA
jgi:hypothetical protein